VCIHRIFFLYTDGILIKLFQDAGEKIMKINSVLVMLCFAMAGLTEAFAVEMNVGVDAELKAVSAFVWRGKTLNEDACFQPSFTAVSGNFSANVWGSWDLTQVSNSWQSSRVDLTIDYSQTMGKHIIRPGFTAFLYHDDPEGKAKDTYECFIGYTYDTFLLPTATLYYDFGEIDGFFLTMSIAHSYTLIKDKMALDMKLQLDGGDEFYVNELFRYPDRDEPTEAKFSQDSMSFVDATATVSLPITMGKNGALTPALKYVMILDAKIIDNVKEAGQDANTFVYSLAYSMTF
jgi:hypothetical protein